MSRALASEATDFILGFGWCFCGGIRNGWMGIFGLLGILGFRRVVGRFCGGKWTGRGLGKVTFSLRLLLLLYLIG